jgi:hypothetical protein
LRLASCCRVLVVKGGAGCRVASRDSTSRTCQAPPRSVFGEGLRAGFVEVRDVTTLGEPILEAAGALVEVAAAGDADVVDVGERGLEGTCLGGAHGGAQVPVAGRAEAQPLQLALHQHTHRDALDATGRELGRDLLP